MFDEICISCGVRWFSDEADACITVQTLYTGSRTVDIGCLSGALKCMLAAQLLLPSVKIHVPDIGSYRGGKLVFITAILNKPGTYRLTWQSSGDIT